MPRYGKCGTHGPFVTESELTPLVIPIDARNTLRASIGISVSNAYAKTVSLPTSGWLTQEHERNFRLSSILLSGLQSS